MKEAMWAVDKTSGKEFSDALAQSGNIFETMGFDCLWDDLTKKFTGRTVPMSEVETFVIEETDYLPTHARSIFATRESTEEIAVHPLPGCKRRGKSFPSDKVQIEFLT